MLSSENRQMAGRKVKGSDSEYTMQVKPKAETPPHSPLSHLTSPKKMAGQGSPLTPKMTGLELAQPEVEIVNGEVEDEPHIPPYVSNLVKPTSPIKRVFSEPKPKDSPFVFAYNLLGRVRRVGTVLLSTGSTR